MANSMTTSDWGIFLGVLSLGLGKLYFVAKRTTPPSQLWKKPRPWQAALLVAAIAFIIFLFFGPY
jgi:hypothetical protein